MASCFELACNPVLVAFQSSGGAELPPLPPRTRWEPEPEPEPRPVIRRVRNQGSGVRWLVSAALALVFVCAFVGALGNLLTVPTLPSRARPISGL